MRNKDNEEEIESCESILASAVLKCLNNYGPRATKRALEWMITGVKLKHEDEDEST